MSTMDLDRFRARVRGLLQQAKKTHSKKSQGRRGGADEIVAAPAPPPASAGQRAHVLNGKLVVTSDDASAAANRAEAQNSYSLQNHLSTIGSTADTIQQKAATKAADQQKRMAEFIPGMDGVTYQDMADYHMQTEDARLQQAREERRRKFLENESGFNKFARGFLGAATQVADLAVNIPGINVLAGDLYKTFAPPGSKYYQEGSLEDKLKGYAVGKVKEGVVNAGKNFIKSKLTGGAGDNMDEQERAQMAAAEQARQRAAAEAAMRFWRQPHAERVREIQQQQRRRILPDVITNRKKTRDGGGAMSAAQEQKRRALDIVKQHWFEPAEKQTRKAHDEAMDAYRKTGKSADLRSGAVALDRFLKASAENKVLGLALDDKRFS